jgi:rhamnose utilization protein RhaD (predicted bifunctional aldolase and dehydrogenase)
MNDESRYITPQKKYADVIVKFTFDESEGVVFKFDILNEKYFDLFEKIKNFYNLKKEFIKICKHLSEDEEYIQNKGGNLSFKYKEKMLITSSGFELKNISMFEGACIVESQNPNNVIFKHGRPSMEVMAHSTLGDAAIHTHPIYLLSILCSKEGKEIIKNLYKNYNFEYIEYTSPGNKLYEQIKKQNSDIIFCENHGLFISNTDLNKCYLLTKEINQIAKEFIRTSVNGVQHTTNNILFPDAAILQQHNKQLNNKIYTNIINCGLTPKFLTNDEINYILNMEEEKYRINK